MVVYATLVKPAAYSTDTCADTRFTLTTKAWARPASARSPAPTRRNHWVSQTGTNYDPGLPFGEYTFCLRDTVRNYSVTSRGELTYNNELPTARRPP